MSTIKILIHDIQDWYYMHQPDCVSEQEINDVINILTKIDEEEQRILKEDIRYDD